jgi:hypothetical protein
MLKRATGGRARVFGLSFKDRAAILPAGHRADACFWLDENGQFCTSTYYASRLPSWVADFNRGRPAARWFGRDWLHLRPDINYVRHSGPDDVEAEGKGFAQGRTFPHPMTGGLKQPGGAYYQALYNSPFGNELLLDLVKRAIDAEGLGQGDVPDLLCISFSCNDPIGHTWGPDSQEVLDVTLRSDLIVRDLLDHLDSRVGRGRYVLALSADHGVCPLPELSQAQGKDAGRHNFPLLAGEAEAFLSAHFSPLGGGARWFEYAAQPPWLYLNQKLLKEYKLDQAEVEETLAHWLLKQPGVQRVYTRTQLQGGRPAGADERVWKSFRADRCGDLMIVPKPWWIFALPFTGGTNHGTPHAYDTHVPLLLYGPGIPAGPRTDPLTPQAITPILARVLGIGPPPSCEAELPPNFLAD